MGRFMCSLGFVIFADLFSSGTVSKTSMRIYRGVVCVVEETRGKNIQTPATRPIAPNLSEGHNIYHSSVSSRVDKLKLWLRLKV
ncbi:hypothetical protein ACROYT_G004420 [Oculina patagonica]